MPALFVQCPYLREFLEDVNKSVQKSGGKLETKEAQQRCQQYRGILTAADTECPEPIRTEDSPKRGRLKHSKSRNLLERLINNEDEWPEFIKIDMDLMSRGAE